MLIKIIRQYNEGHSSLIVLSYNLNKQKMLYLHFFFIFYKNEEKMYKWLHYKIMLIKIILQFHFTTFTLLRKVIKMKMLIKIIRQYNVCGVPDWTLVQCCTPHTSLLT